MSPEARKSIFFWSYLPKKEKDKKKFQLINKKKTPWYL